MGDKPDTDVVVRMTKTSTRGWVFGIRYRKGQIGVIMNAQKPEDGKYKIKIVIGAKGKFFTKQSKPNIRHAMKSDFEVIQYGNEGSADGTDPTEGAMLKQLGLNDYGAIKCVPVYTCKPTS